MPQPVYRAAGRRTVEAVKEDFFSILFGSGLETILSAEVNAELAAKKHATSTASEQGYLLPCHRRFHHPADV